MKKAVLIVHGFAGSTYDEETLANYLELDPRLDVFSFTLPGHENNLFMKCRYEQWIDASKKQVEFLIHHGYKSIYVIGHSMGGVISCFLATQYKEIKKLVLAAPAFICAYDKNNKLTTNLKNGKIIIQDYGYEEVIKRALKSSIRSAREFMKLVDKYYNTPKEINIPTLIIQGLNDNIVPKKSSLYVYNCLKGKKKIMLIDGINHDIFHSSKFELINRKILLFLKHNNFLNNKRLLNEVESI